MDRINVIDRALQVSERGPTSMQVACPNKDCPWRPARTYVNTDRTARGVAHIRDDVDTAPRLRFSGKPPCKHVLRRGSG